MVRPVRPGLSLNVCPIARALALVGERTTLLILRSVFLGVSRFNHITNDNDLSRNVVSSRLRALIDAGILERRPYQELKERPRYDYHLTAMGRDLLPVVLALAQWGEKYLADDVTVPLDVAHRMCGAPVHVTLRCGAHHQPLEPRTTTARLTPRSDR